MARSDVGLAVIGTGAWGIHHVRVFAAEPRCAIRWVCDRDPVARDRAHGLAPRAQVTDDATRVLMDPAVDAVVIATPAVSHASLTCAALEAGKHVLVEKPLAMSVPDAERAAAMARHAKRILLVGHLMLFHPAVLRLKELLAAGHLGELFYLHSTRVNLGRLRRDENALWSFGPHDLAMIDYLLDDTPLHVSASGRSYLQPGVEDVVFASMHFAGGLMAHVHLSWLDPRKERRLTLVGSQMMAEFDDMAADKLRIFDRGYDRPPAFGGFDEYLTLRHGDIHIPSLAMEEPLRAEARHFLDCIVDGVAPRAGAASAVRVVTTLAAAQSSLDRGGAPAPVNPGALVDH